MRPHGTFAKMPCMSGADFEFEMGQCVRAADASEGVIEHLGRIWGRPAYYVRTEDGYRWYEQTDLAPVETDGDRPAGEE